MTSNILNNLGLGNLDIGIFFIILFTLLLATIILLIVFIVKTVKLKKRYDAFMLGKDGKSLEEEIAALFEINKSVAERLREDKKDIRKIYKKLSNTFQKIGIVKYDAYQHMGGLLSFSMAMLDENNNGYIMNSVHSTDGCYTYTKEIIKGECSVELGNEEKVALEKAMDIS